MTWVLFLIFLIYAAYEKVAATPPPLDKAILMADAFVLAATVITPFFIAYVLTRATQVSGRTPAVMIGFIAAITLSVAGYGAVWKYYSDVIDLPSTLGAALQWGLASRPRHGHDPGRRQPFSPPRLTGRDGNPGIPACRSPGRGWLPDRAGCQMSHQIPGQAVVHLVYSWAGLK